MIKIPALKIIHAYNAHCFCGHSPIAQADSTKKLRMLHANNKAPHAMLNLFTLMDGIAKNIIASMPT